RKAADHPLPPQAPRRDDRWLALLDPPARARRPQPDPRLRAARRRTMVDRAREPPDPRPAARPARAPGLALSRRGRLPAGPGGRRHRGGCPPRAAGARVEQARAGVGTAARTRVVHPRHRGERRNGVPFAPRWLTEVRALAG